MKKNLLPYAALTCCFIMLTLFLTSKGEKALTPEKDINRSVLPQMVKGVNMSKKYTYAGERIPTDNFDVRQRLDYELTTNAYRHGKTVINMKRASRYFPVIEPIFKAQGIPDDLKYIAVAESDLSNATSPAGAKGFWQFMPAVAKQYGLEVNSEVDERYHLEKATLAATKLLRDYHRRFDDWVLATAAYNGGIGRIGRSLKEQKGGTFYDLNLNQETSRYVFRVIAMKEIMNNPKNFGFYLDEDDLYPALGNYYHIDVNTTIEDLAAFARNNGASYRTLKAYNPWLRTTKLTNAKRKTYQIRIPYQKF
ncbi:MAG: lytic transglycosylase domain-containing protein [Bacteroidota bacterium]